MDQNTRRDKAITADINCRKHLALATDAKDAGNTSKADVHERKAQYWLDRWNRLTGDA